MTANRRVWTLLTLTVILTVLPDAKSQGEDKLRGIFSWKALDFAFSSERARNAAISRKEFIPGAPVPIDVDYYRGGGTQKAKVLVTIPRFQDGVPATLGYVTERLNAEGNPIIAPYPNWEWQSLGNCDAITSVYRVKVDQCDRLWVLDTGKLGDRQICQPQLLVFHMRTDKLLTRYRFPRDRYKEDSLFITVAVDVRDCEKCRDTFAYISDVAGFGLIVYNHATSSSWRIENRLFYPYPPHGRFHIKGDEFDLMDGIFGLALGPIKPDGDRILYFHSLASTTESWVPASIIRNASLFEHDAGAVPRAFQEFAAERPSQSAAQAMDRDGVLFFGLMSNLAIGCWNSRNYPEFGGANIEIIARNPETLQFASGLKIVSSRNGRQELWVLTCSFQRFMTGRMSPNETNFRIQAGFVDELVRGTKCDVASLNIHGGRLESSMPRIDNRLNLPLL